MAAYGPDPHSRPAAAPNRPTSSSGAAPPAGESSAAAAADKQPWVLLKRHEVDSGPNAALEISRGGRLLALGQAEGGLLVSSGCFGLGWVMGNCVA